ncbi:amidohydrolase family protein [Paenibacillaceae bacterium WGS1546]|uniref:amidohydrolase family protein n=1 Tax=Cohnella sp. WGS1546 TaxID=3366810 RepID=UPI00372D1084
MRFDAHQHFWNIERLHYPILSPEAFGELYRTIEPPELEPLLRDAGIDGTVVVQAKDGLDETEYLLELAERYPWIAGVVGWVDLASPEQAAAQLEAFGRHPKFKGVRHLIMVEPDDDWLVRPDVLEGLRVLADSGFAFDAGAEFPKHLRHVETIARAVPGLRIVIDHLAKPPVGERDMAAWEAELAGAAAFPNVYCKLSGLNVASPIEPAVRTALRLFGARRLMLGSDWPISNSGLPYGEALDRLVRAAGDLSREELDALLGGSAKEFYRL